MIRSRRRRAQRTDNQAMTDAVAVHQDLAAEVARLGEWVLALRKEINRFEDLRGRREQRER